MNLKRWPIVFLMVVALVASAVPASITTAATPTDAPAAQAVDRAASLKIALGGPITAPDNLNLYAPGGNIGNGVHEEGEAEAEPNRNRQQH